jgi:G3E family GTPase
MFSVFMEMGGELYRQQIETAHTILVSHCENETDREQLQRVTRELRKLNPQAYIIAEPWNGLSALEVLTVAEEQSHKFAKTLKTSSHVHHGYDYGQHHENEGFSVLAGYPYPKITDGDLKNFIVAVREGHYGRVFRAKCLLTMQGGERLKGDYVYGKWKQVSYPGEGEDKIVLIGKDLRIPPLNIFKQ